MTDDEKAEWKGKELWYERDLEALLCGLPPDPGRPNSAALNKAREAISLAVLAGKLTVDKDLDP